MDSVLSKRKRVNPTHASADSSQSSVDPRESSSSSLNSSSSTSNSSSASSADVSLLSSASSTSASSARRQVGPAPATRCTRRRVELSASELSTDKEDSIVDLGISITTTTSTRTGTSESKRVSLNRRLQLYVEADDLLSAMQLRERSQYGSHHHYHHAASHASYYNRGKAKKQARRRVSVRSAASSSTETEMEMGPDEEVQEEVQEEEESEADREQELLLRRKLEAQRLEWERLARYADCRCILVDWISEVCASFNMRPTTVHMAVGYLDRFLALTPLVSRDRLQLVATAAILISAKIEETEENIPCLADLNYCCENAYSQAHIIAMESVMLTTLDWDVQLQTTQHFVEFYAQGYGFVEGDRLRRKRDFSADGAAALHILVVNRASFFSSLALRIQDYLKYPPSLVAAACVAVARRSASVEPVWSQDLEQWSGYSVDELAECVASVWDLYTQTFEVTAAISKTTASTSDATTTTTTTTTISSAVSGAASISMVSAST
eukprot:CAMPEP_0177666166 /NCGR_PEP_ID=MMETSP0447-20121125/21439_1 /TAXON_ID=0 /ORGANISM="Stygamoeba regulata, Strain BSH-02190019" /LENGTH=496 /DNA_ID=CAMNT_0019172301 /DNA_START=123 /DNA_END=1613 /DNA_ORIENTATION=+